MFRKKIQMATISSLIISLLCIPVVSADSNPVALGQVDQFGAGLSQDISTMEASDVLTFDELVLVYAENEGVTVEQARDILLKSYTSNKSRTSGVNPQLATFRTFEAQLDAMRYYKPSLRFYCETSEGGYFHGIVQVLNTAMDRVYQGIAKQFSGSVFTYLENANTIHYMVDGDFFDNGTTTTSGGGSAKIGEYFTVTYSISYSSNWYATIYEENDYIWY